MSPIGDRLGDVRRRRGLTQEQLAESSGVAVSTLRKIEQGARTGARLETLHKLARGLDVPTSELFELQQWAPEPVGESQELNLMALRAALTPVPKSVRPSTVSNDDAGDPAASVEAAWRMYHANAYTAVADQLPAVLARTRLAGDTSSLLSALKLATHLMTQYNQTDLAYYPVTEGIELAESAGDTLMAGTLTNSLGWVLTRQGRLDETRQVATAMADRLEPRLSQASPAELSVWGWLLLRASSAAVRDNRPEEADDMLSLASAASRRVPSAGTPDDHRHWSFSPKLVAMKRVENAIVTDNPDKALKLTGRIPATGRVPDSDLNRHRLDVASAHVSMRDYTQAFDVLRGIRREAPEWLRHQRLARDTLTRALHLRVRPVNSGVRELADFLHVD